MCNLLQLGYTTERASQSGDIGSVEALTGLDEGEIDLEELSKLHRFLYAIIITKLDEAAVSIRTVTGRQRKTHPSNMFSKPRIDHTMCIPESLLDIILLGKG
jgi:hypothetical protein